MQSPRRRIAVAVVLGVLGITGGVAAAQDPGRGIDPNQGESLVEVSLPSKGAALRLQLEAERLRRRVQRPLPPPQRRRHGHGHRLWHAGRHRRARRRGLRRRRDHRGSGDLARADRRPPGGRARGESRLAAAEGEQVERLAHGRGRDPAGRLLREPRWPLPVRGGEDPRRRRRPKRRATRVRILALSWDSGPGTPINEATARIMSTNVDPDTEPNTYIEHRELVRIGEPGTASPPRPAESASRPTPARRPRRMCRPGSAAVFRP